MTDYTPTTELVQNTYANDRVDEEDRNGNGDEYDEFMAQEEFDRWLQSVKAEVWDRCVSEMPIDLDWKNFYSDNNPYRKETV